MTISNDEFMNKMTTGLEARCFDCSKIWGMTGVELMSPIMCPDCGGSIVTPSGKVQLGVSMKNEEPAPELKGRFNVKTGIKHRMHLYDPEKDQRLFTAIPLEAAMRVFPVDQTKKPFTLGLYYYDRFLKSHGLEERDPNSKVD